MEIQLDKGETEWTLRPLGEMTIYRAADGKTPLLAAAAEAPALIIDLSQVEELDTSGVQLLLLVAREARRGGKAVRLGACSPAAEEALDLAGVTADLTLPVPVPEASA